MDNLKFQAAIANLEAWLGDNDARRKRVECMVSALKGLVIMNNDNTPLSLPGNFCEGIATITPSDRVNAALRGMSGRFRRKDLYFIAENDGRGKIAKGTFACIFSKLQQRGIITVVEGEFGSRKAVYMKTDEHKALQQNTALRISELQE